MPPGSSQPSGVGQQRGGVGLGSLGQALPQQPIRLGTRQFGFAPAAIQKLAFGTAQLLADLAIAGGLFGLPGQLRQLLRQRFQHIIDAQKVGFRP